MADTSPIFVTARFRSGSTMLWSIFDRAEGYRAYYEPLHDGLLHHIRYTAPMASHRRVGSYWSSYVPLLDELPKFHRPQFGLTRLVLEADEEWPELEDYIRFLIERSGDDVPVLQFNRADFRLPWLRARFPEARIIHLHRDVRDSWYSFIRHLPTDWEDDPRVPNVYDLYEWCLSLAKSLPFLVDTRIDSLYTRHYLLWRLSLLIGQRHADQSLSFEETFGRDTQEGLRRLIELGLLEETQFLAALTGIDVPHSEEKTHTEPRGGFERHERAGDELLARLGLEEDFGREPLSAIRASHADAWDAFPVDLRGVFEDLLVAYSAQRSDVTRLLYVVRRLEDER